MSTINCPNCGIELEEALQLIRCPVCDALLDSTDVEEEDDLEEEWDIDYGDEDPEGELDLWVELDEEWEDELEKAEESVTFFN